MPRWFDARTFLKVFLVFGFIRVFGVSSDSPAFFLVVLAAWASYELIERYAWGGKRNEGEIR